jgi:transcriptional antiterminator
MLLINDENENITITKVAKALKCSTRTIYRNMSNELKKEKELLNQQI